MSLTFWPRSLLWRTFMLLAALVLATTAAWFGIFRAYEVEPRARQISQNLISIVNITRTALITSQPERRHELLSELAEREGIQVYPSEPGERIALLPTGVARGHLRRRARAAWPALSQTLAAVLRHRGERGQQNQGDAAQNDPAFHDMLRFARILLRRLPTNARPGATRLSGYRIGSTSP